ncbi:MAG: metallophosphoesterase [Clostridia bacterium]|nr:metallophosphoesterase [Clostridia bacterium]
MSLYVLADLHLSGTVNKSMEVFGPRWSGYTEKIQKNWSAVVTDEDTVVLPGDISWGMTLDEAEIDLRFIDSLPGRKLLGKGNHDFWWSTATKMRTFFAEKHLSTLDILYNNAHRLSDCIVCGTRGWFNDEKQQNTAFPTDYAKIVNREVQRLQISLDAAEALRAETPELPVLVFLHFPPVWGSFVCREIVELLQERQIRKCYFGHIHGAYNAPRCTTYEGIDMILCSADYLKFAPMPIYPDMD